MLTGCMTHLPYSVSVAVCGSTCSLLVISLQDGQQDETPIIAQLLWS